MVSVCCGLGMFLLSIFLYFEPFYAHIMFLFWRRFGKLEIRNVWEIVLATCV
jgi:hypothetical protein